MSTRMHPEHEVTRVHSEHEVTFAPVSGLTHADLLRWYPDDDGYRRELIAGELYVSPAPSTRHQDVVLTLAVSLVGHATRHDGRCFVAPYEVWLGERDVPQPDVLYVAAANRDRVDAARLVGPPDLAVEVASPSSRRVDHLVKRDLYEHAGVAHYWVVDLEQDAVVVHDLHGDAYATARITRHGERLTAAQADGFATTVDAVLLA